VRIITVDEENREGLVGEITEELTQKNLNADTEVNAW
jgi:hypothetical protein